MDKKKPFFSIIIPTYNRPNQLAACLQSLVKLDYPANRFEVIAVDDGGSVLLEPVVATVRNQLDIKLIAQTNAGPASARNTGAANAKGTHLAFIDDDCFPDPNWLQVLASRFRETPDCILGGRTINLLKNNIYSTMSQLIIDVVYRHYNADPYQSRFFATNNMALPTDRFFAIGKFNSDFTTSEDREFCNRCLYHGFQMIYDPAAIVYHAHLLKFLTFCRQHFNYGRGAFRFHLTRTRSGSGSSLEDIKFHLDLGNWLFYPITQVKGRQLGSLGALLIVWQITNAAGFLWEAGYHGIRSIKNPM